MPGWGEHGGLVAPAGQGFGEQVASLFRSAHPGAAYDEDIHGVNSVQFRIIEASPGLGATMILLRHDAFFFPPRLAMDSARVRGRSWRDEPPWVRGIPRTRSVKFVPDPAVRLPMIRPQA